MDNNTSNAANIAWTDPCDECGETVTFHKSDVTATCTCGASYNSFGQRVRGNPYSEFCLRGEDAVAADRFYGVGRR